MKLLSSLLLAFLNALSSLSVSSSATLVVSQSPDVSVMEGETVHITCCWTGEFERMSLNWQKNLTNIKTETFLKNSSQGSLQKETPVCTNLTFTKTTREDSGRYACKLSVEIPFFITVIGNGTVITVMARDDNKEDNTRGVTGKGTVTKDNRDPPIAGGSHWEEVLIYVPRCLPILALVISFLCLKKLGAKAQQCTPAAPGNKVPSAQRIEEDKEEEERDERETEAE